MKQGFLCQAEHKLSIVTEKGSKNMYNVSTKSKQHFTVLGCVSVNGSCMKPFVIFPGMRPTYNFKDVEPQDYDIGHTPNG